VRPESPQTAERVIEETHPTPTEKLTVGYKSPAFGDFDYPALALLNEVLFGGRASRVQKRLVRELEIASDVRSFVGPFRDPSLLEIFASARGTHRAEEMLTVIDEELARVCQEPVPTIELERARARMELSLLSGLETVDGKASTIGFYEAVLGRPMGAFERLEAVRRVDRSDLLRVARRDFDKRQRTVILVRATLKSEKEAS
jgi:zinc protease